MGTYQHQPVGTQVRLGVLVDVPIWHPRSHDANRKQCLGNVDDRENIRVGGNGVAPVDIATEALVWSTLSMPLIKEKSHVHFQFASNKSNRMCELL